MNNIATYANYGADGINQRDYTFRWDSRSRIIVKLSNIEKENYKYCTTCDICYKKNYFNAHKKNSLHKEKNKLLKEQITKIDFETSLKETIFKSLDIKLKDNDIRIVNTIQNFLTDQCKDCYQHTTNPGTIIRNGVETNICQPCYKKYKTCCCKTCNYIGTTFNECNGCKKTGCNRHMKKGIVNKKWMCVECSHVELDNEYDCKVYNDMENEIKSLRQHLNSREKDVKQLKEELISKNIELINQTSNIKKQKKKIKKREIELQSYKEENERYKQVNREIEEDYEERLSKMKEEYERKLLEQKASFFDIIMKKFGF